MDSPETLKKLSTIGGLRGAVLRDAHELPIAKAPTQKQAVDAFLWKQLDVDTDRAFGLTAVKELLLARALGGGGGMTATQMTQALPAKAVGARGGDAANLRLAGLQRLLESADPPGETPQPPPESETAMALEDFARAVQKSAAQSATGRFGTHKIFIAHAFDAFVIAYPDAACTLETFKTRLVEANRAGLLVLARADLVQAMDPGDVARSSTRYLNAEYHFSRLEEGA